MKLAEDIKPVTYLKNNASQLVRSVSERGRTVTITQNGEAKAVLKVVPNYPRVRHDQRSEQTDPDGDDGKEPQKRQVEVERDNDGRDRHRGSDAVAHVERPEKIPGLSFENNATLGARGVGLEDFPIHRAFETAWTKAGEDGSQA